MWFGIVAMLAMIVGLGVWIEYVTPNISCQGSLVEKNREMFLFDLQTVGFLALKNATIIADSVRSEREDPSLTSANPNTCKSSFRDSFWSKRLLLKICTRKGKGVSDPSLFLEN
jgi:hypothetical protein